MSYISYVNLICLTENLYRSLIYKQMKSLMFLIKLGIVKLRKKSLSYKWNAAFATI